MSTITVQAPVRVEEPRATRLAARLFLGLLQWFEAASDARAERRTRADRASEAAAVRNYALRFASHDPRFSADLLAAADRHERSE